MSNCKNNTDFSKDFPNIFITFYLLYCCNAQTAVEFPNKEGDTISALSSLESRKGRMYEEQKDVTSGPTDGGEERLASQKCKAQFGASKKKVYEYLETRRPLETDMLLVKTYGQVLQVISQNLPAQLVID